MNEPIEAISLIISLIFSTLNLYFYFKEVKIRKEKETQERKRENAKHWFREIVLNRSLDKIDEMFSQIENEVSYETNIGKAQEYCQEQIGHVKKILLPLLKVTNSALNTTFLSTINAYEDLTQKTLEELEKLENETDIMRRYHISRYKNNSDIKKFELIKNLYEYSRNE